MSAFKDRTNRTFGRLTAAWPVGRAGRLGNKRIVWLCFCECGAGVLVESNNLATGHIQSCGCLKAEHPNNQKHGKCYTPEYKAWRGMKARCTNPHATNFKYWGGRGVSVCERWLNSFENFLFDMGPRPSRNHSLDRFPNPDGNYEPKNCRWATPWQQRHNRRFQ